MMTWNRLTKEQVAEEYPRAVVPIVAAFWPEVTAEDKGQPDVDEREAYYRDMTVCIHEDGTVGMRMMELSLNDLRYLHTVLAREYRVYEIVKMNSRDGVGTAGTLASRAAHGRSGRDSSTGGEGGEGGAGGDPGQLGGSGGSGGNKL